MRLGISRKHSGCELDKKVESLADKQHNGLLVSILGSAIADLLEETNMTVRYCISQKPDKNWTVIDRQAGPDGNESQPVAPDFIALLDAIHYMFSHGHGEFCVQKPF